jgi:DNA-directed RNA polymerase subunit alpha
MNWEQRILNMGFEELGLSIRAINCLESEGMRTVRELVVNTEEQLLLVRNFGTLQLKDVKERLQQYGLRLGMRLP